MHPDKTQRSRLPGTLEGSLCESRRCSGWEISSILILALVMAGCRVTIPIKPGELKRLDGYRRGGVVLLEDMGGRLQKFGGRIEHLLHHKGTKPTISHVYEAIEIEDGVLYGTAVDGTRVRAPLDEVGGVQISAISYRRTAGTVLGTIGGVALVIAAVLVIVFVIWAYEALRSYDGD